MLHTSQRQRHPYATAEGLAGKGLAGSGDEADPVYVRIVSEPAPPWWLITIGTVAVTYLTQVILSKAWKR